MNAFFTLRRGAGAGILFTLFVLLCAGLSSCNVKKHKKKYTVGFSQCTMVNKFRSSMLQEMKRELSFHPDIDFIFRDANGSAARQIEQIQELIGQKVDLLIVTPIEAAPITPIVEKAYNNGTRVIIVERNITSDNYTAYVGASNFEVGYNAGTFAYSFLKGKGRVLEVSDLPGSSADIERNKGFKSFINQHPGIAYAGKVYEEGDENPSNEHTRRFLLADTSVQLIFAQNDRLAFSVAKVLKSMGLDKKISIVGVDGLAGENAGIDLVNKGILKATILYPTGGEEAILTAANMLENKPYKKENRLMTSIIDSSNVRITKMQGAKIIEQQRNIDRSQAEIEKQELIADNQSNIIFTISISLALALIMGAIMYYYLQENRKINNTLALQKEEISNQRNKLIEVMTQLKEATDAKFNFFINMSHELKTPLTLMMAPVEDMLSSPRLHFSMRNNLELIKRNTVRLSRLINQLMDFRKMEECKMKLHVSENNLGDFVLEITGAFKEVAKKKNMSFNTLIKAKHLLVWFDTTMIDKVLFNLLSNAFKFTGSRGTINVTVDKTADGEYAILKVEDDGIGMSRDDVEHAFEVFYQGHSSTFKGTGLGLSLSKELISLHHGEISVTSEKGKGTSFEVLLPLTNRHFTPEEIVLQKGMNDYTIDDAAIYTTDAAPLTMQKEFKAVAEKEHSLLLIEDNDELLHFLKQRFENEYDVHVAETAEEGVTMAFDIIPDVIISDIILPNMNGLQLTEKLKLDVRTAYIPIILLTAKSSVQEQIEGIRCKADEFIVKPFNLQYLEEKVKNLLQNRASLKQHYTCELPAENRLNALTKTDRKFISQFTAIIESNLANEDFSAENISRGMGLSRVQLYRKVKTLLGYNVNEYLLNMRLQKSKYLLQHEGVMTISQVSAEVGFSSPTYFATVFKSKFGVTPKEYKMGK